MTPCTAGDIIALDSKFPIETSTEEELGHRLWGFHPLFYRIYLVIT